MSVRKYIEVDGSSKKSFADAASKAVSGAAKTVRGLESGEVARLHFQVKNGRVVEYNASVKLAFVVKR